MLRITGSTVHTEQNLNIALVPKSVPIHPFSLFFKWGLYSLFLCPLLLICTHSNKASVSIIPLKELWLGSLVTYILLKPKDNSLSSSHSNSATFSITGPSSFLRTSLTNLLYLNVEFTLNSALTWTTSQAPSQSHVLSHFFGPDRSVLGCHMAHFSALFLTFSVLLPTVIWSNLWLSVALFADNSKFAFSSPDLTQVLHKQLPDRHLHRMLHKHLSLHAIKSYFFSPMYFKLLPPSTSYHGKWCHHSSKLIKPNSTLCPHTHI